MDNLWIQSKWEQS